MTLSMAQETIDEKPRSALGVRVRLLGSLAMGQVAALWVLVGPLAGLPWIRGFRNYFANDQLSYAAIATTIAGGNLSPVEPLTETGVSYYPSAWYYVVGLASWVTGAPVYALWQILGLIAVGVAVALLGWLGYRLSGNTLAPLLPGLALATGTFSTFIADYWYTSLGYHAVIWGPFGTLFTLNAEAIGLVSVAAIFAWLVVTAVQSQRSGVQFPPSVAVIVAAALGALANVQTYSFFTGTSLVVAFLAIAALLLRPSRTQLVVTVSAVVVVLLLGNYAAGVVGPLPLFVLLIGATVPAYWPWIVENRRMTSFVLGAFSISASPQVIRTAVGLVTGDEFLGYRQESTEDLGIDVLPALIGALPLIAMGVVLLVAAASRPRTAESRIIGAAIAAFALGAGVMSTNDLWGFEQEPYRFWLQYSIVGLLVFATLLPWAWSRRVDVTSRAWRSTVALTVAAGVVWAVSLVDVMGFREYVRAQGVIPAEDGFSQALREIVPQESGLVFSSACLDPQVLRLVTGAPVAYFNRGLAWPDKRVEIDRLLDPGRVAASDPAQLAAAGVSHVVTDSSCEGEWAYQDARIQPERLEPYPGGTLTLWRVAQQQQ